jgi:hypothetical protein
MRVEVEFRVSFQEGRAGPSVKRRLDSRFIAVATLDVTQKPTGLLIGGSASIGLKYFFHESAR